MTPEEAVAKLDAITGDNEKYSSVIRPGQLNPATAHPAADNVVYQLIASIAPEVREAWDRVVDRADDWWYS